MVNALSVERPSFVDQVVIVKWCVGYVVRRVSTTAVRLRVRMPGGFGINSCQVAPIIE